MSGEKIQQTLDYIDKHGVDRPYLNEKYCVSDDEISKAEKQIGFSFPKSYREFLEKLGNGDFDGIEFYGLVSGNLDIEEIPNALWLTLDMRESENLPKELFVIESLGDGTNACLLLSDKKDDECAVVLWDYGMNFNNSKPDVLASSFGDYFYKRITETMEPITS